MTSLASIEQMALSLPEKDRAALATQILGSLPGPLLQEDENFMAEVARRDAELVADPSSGMDMKQLDRLIKARRSK